MQHFEAFHTKNTYPSEHLVFFTDAAQFQAIVRCHCSAGYQDGAEAVADRSVHCRCPGRGGSFPPAI
jgi:hypothetical protein